MDQTTSTTDKTPEQPKVEVAASTTLAESTRRRNTATAVVAIGAAILMPELVPGIAIGLVAALAPKYFPRFAPYLRRAKEKASHAADRIRNASARSDAPVPEQTGDRH